MEKFLIRDNNFYIILKTLTGISKRILRSTGGIDYITRTDSATKILSRNSKLNPVKGQSGHSNSNLDEKINEKKSL